MSNEKTNRKRFNLKSIIDGSFLISDTFIKYLPFILYVSFLFIIYIVNTYISIQTIFETENIKKELVELKNNHITIKSKLMVTSNLSKVTEKLEPIEVKPSHVPPYKIFVNKNDNE